MGPVWDGLEQKQVKFPTLLGNCSGSVTHSSSSPATAVHDPSVWSHTSNLGGPQVRKGSQQIRPGYENSRPVRYFPVTVSTAAPRNTPD